MAEKFIQKAIKHPGRIRKYLQSKYGSGAFDKGGGIKVSYIQRALSECKRTEKCDRSLIGALNLAKRFVTRKI